MRIWDPGGVLLPHACIPLMDHDDQSVMLWNVLIPAFNASSTYQLYVQRQCYLFRLMIALPTCLADFPLDGNFLLLIPCITRPTQLYRQTHSPSSRLLFKFLVANVVYLRRPCSYHLLATYLTL